MADCGSKLPAAARVTLVGDTGFSPLHLPPRSLKWQPVRCQPAGRPQAGVEPNDRPGESNRPDRKRNLFRDLRRLDPKMA